MSIEFFLCFFLPLSLSLSNFLLSSIFFCFRSLITGIKSGALKNSKKIKFQRPSSLHFIDKFIVSYIFSLSPSLYFLFEILICERIESISEWNRFPKIEELKLSNRISEGGISFALEFKYLHNKWTKISVLNLVFLRKAVIFV